MKQIQKRIYLNKNRKFKRAVKKFYAIMASIIIGSAFVGWHTVRLNSEIDGLQGISVAKAQETQNKGDKELSVIERIINASGGENIDVLINLAKCESNYKEDVLHVNTNDTVDLGVFQINSIHKDISNIDKLNVEKATEWTNKKIKEGKGNIWVCWKKI